METKGSYKDHCFHTDGSTLLWPTGGDRGTLKNKTKQTLLKMFQSFSKNAYMEYFKKYIYRRGFIFTKCHQFLSASKGMNGEGNGTPLQCSCLENPKDGGAWWAAVHGVAKSRIGLSDFTFTFHFHTLEKEMATHSSILAWRIPGMREPGGLPSMGSHRVGHD